MTRRRWLIDVDGPVARFIHAVHQAVEQVTGNPVHPEDMPYLHFDTGGRLVYERWGVNHVIIKPGFCEGLDVVEGAREVIEEIRKTDEVRFVTAPSQFPTWAYERELWLIGRLGATRNEVIQSVDKNPIRGHVFVEDNISNLLAWEKENEEWGNPGVPLLWDMPYNRHDTRFRRVKSWREILDAGRNA